FVAERSPLRAGFGVLQQRPALALAEIVWRWTFASCALLLIFFAVRQILSQIEVTPADLAVSSRSSALVTADILARALPLGARALLACLCAILLLWIVSASLGRLVLLSELMKGVDEPRAGTLSSRQLSGTQLN